MFEKSVLLEMKCCYWTICMANICCNPGELADGQIDINTSPQTPMNQTKTTKHRTLQY